MVGLTLMGRPARTTEKRDGSGRRAFAFFRIHLASCRVPEIDDLERPPVPFPATTRHGGFEMETTTVQRPGVVSFIGVILYIQAFLALVAAVSLHLRRRYKSAPPAALFDAGAKQV